MIRILKQNRVLEASELTPGQTKAHSMWLIIIVTWCRSTAIVSYTNCGLGTMIIYNVSLSNTIQSSHSFTIQLKCRTCPLSLACFIMN